MKRLHIFGIVAIAGIALAASLFSFKAEPMQNTSADHGQFSQKLTKLAYQPNENLKYRIHYGVVNAAVVNMSVSDPIMINNRKALSLKVEGETLSSFEWLYIVRDKFESWVDAENHTPLRYAKTVRENDYYFQDVVIYNHKDKFLKNKKGKLPITENTQDVAAAIYYLRNLDYSNKVIGHEFPLDIYIDNQVYKLKLKYAGKETIKTDIGKVRCIKLKPELVVDRVFKSKDAMTVWVSDDDNHIPVRIQTDIYVGSLKVDIVKTENLKSPMTSLVKK